MERIQATHPKIRNGLEREQSDLKEEWKVKIITDPEEQKRILEACHSDVTSGHFGVTNLRRVKG